MVEDSPDSRSGSAPAPRRPVTDGGASAGNDGADSTADETDRRRLIMYVLAVAFAVPLVVEGATFVGLVGSYVGDGGAAAASTTPKPAAGLAEGEELLDETDRTERVTTLALRSSEAAWMLTLSVRVENGGDLPCELRLGAVTTQSGQRVAGSATTGRVESGTTATVSAQWSLPEGERPRTVAVTAVEFEDGERVLVEREVSTGHVPVQS